MLVAQFLGYYVDVSEEEQLIIICVNIFKVIHHNFLHYFCAANMKVLYAHYVYKLLFIHVIHASVHVSEKKLFGVCTYIIFCLLYACVGIGFVD